MAEPPPLISAAALARRLDEDHPVDRDHIVVCDVRFHLDDLEQGRREYDEAHIPGARFIDLHHDLAETTIPDRGRHPLPSPGAFTELLGRNGIDPDTLVVAYDSADGATASRLWWMLRSIGHAQATVLDGGWAAWTAGANPVDANVPATATTVYPPAGAWTGVVDANTIPEAIAAGIAVVDARAPERFRGETEPIDPRAGHIPGAVNRFHANTVGAGGTHLPAALLASQFADLGPRPIVYCGSGVTACHTLLAMSIAGIEGARLYPGSWSEWSADPDREVATT